MAAASWDSSQHATDASTTVGASQAQSSAYVVERAEEHHQLSHVSLLGALHGSQPEDSWQNTFWANAS